MDNQHKRISGYRDLSQQEIDLINEIKTQGSALGLALDAIEKLEGVDKRWVAIARTDLQKGLMALVRAIARPAGF